MATNGNLTSPHKTVESARVTMMDSLDFALYSSIPLLLVLVLRQYSLDDAL